MISFFSFGTDDSLGRPKVGVIWYKDARGILVSVVGRENGWVVS